MGAVVFGDVAVTSEEGAFTQKPLIALSPHCSNGFPVLQLSLHRDMEILVPTSHSHSRPGDFLSSSGLTFALQALLNRHESYVSESQQEHQRLTSYIKSLENERTSLQTTNEKIVEENRQLLTQLEAANSSLKDSDSHVKGLEALLRDCEVEVRRLNLLCQQTEELELKILELEKDRSTFSRQADDAKEESRSTIKRWKESEVKLRQLEKEAQRIEWEAKMDKERYEELIARLERERVLERELGGAEGRLKGAAAVRGLNGKEKGTNVVSHFVRDILQDNANLQAGIVELRELLQTSNEEVQNLREQILQHQPVEDGDTENLSRSVPLSEQVGWAEPASKVQQSVHVHHHYHAKLGKRERTPTSRRPSRKRMIVGLGMLPSTPESSAPATPIVGPHRFVSSPILPTGLHQPQAQRNRWSMQSTATASSMASSFPSSPVSYVEQHNSVFDRIEADEESSRPTSPESAGYFRSPLKFTLPSVFQETMSDVVDEEEEDVVLEDVSKGEAVEHSNEDIDTFSPAAEESKSRQLTPKPSQILVVEAREDESVQPEPPDPAVLIDEPGEVEATKTPTIVIEEFPIQSDAPEMTKIVVEETSTQSEAPNLEPGDHISSSPTTYEGPDVPIIPTLRRSGSHDSLVSISGMDIHIAKRPTMTTSQPSSLIKGNRAYFALPPSVARRVPSAQPLATVTEYTASSSTPSFRSDSSIIRSAELSLPPRSVSSSVAALSGIASLPASPQASSAGAGGLTRLVGGWVKGRWGIAPVKSHADLRSSAAASISTSSSTDTTPFGFPSGRSPGINQKGFIPGLRPPQRIMGVQATKVDEQGLKDSLAE